MTTNTDKMRAALTELGIAPHAEILDLIEDADARIASLEGEIADLKACVKEGVAANRKRVEGGQ